MFDKEMAHSASYCSDDDCTEINCPVADFGDGPIWCHVLQMHQTKSRFVRLQIRNRINIPLFRPVHVEFEFDKSVVCMGQQQIKGPDTIG